MTRVNEKPLMYPELLSLSLSRNVPLPSTSPVNNRHRIRGILARALESQSILKVDQTTFARLSTGHLKSIRFSNGAKTFPICTKCIHAEATTQYLLDSIDLI
ncbi:hypothetical protein TNCV_980161 [Trichonephila clavipes]|uniref:Uncharacterized protein n=1 Tax=Trichonephila clavipes TaxID=2585209 RepID=A0A8X6RYG3_TRICX|nr:hypothetical protein TNCV_980161 [Trichonephila clavipes]